MRLTIQVACLYFFKYLANRQTGHSLIKIQQYFFLKYLTFLFFFGSSPQIVTYNKILNRFAIGYFSLELFIVDIANSILYIKAIIRTVKLSFPNLFIPHDQGSCPKYFVFLIISSIAIKQAFLPNISTLTLFVPSNKISLKTISIWKYLHSFAIRKIVLPISFIGISLFYKFAFHVLLVILYLPYIVFFRRRYEQTLGALRYCIFEISYKILAIFCNHLSLSMWYTLPPTASIVDSIDSYEVDIVNYQCISFLVPFRLRNMCICIKIVILSSLSISLKYQKPKGRSFSFKTLTAQLLGGVSLSTTTQLLQRFYSLQISDPIIIKYTYHKNLIQLYPLLCQCYNILVMILLRTNIVHLYHFARPAISNLSSLSELEQLMQQRLLTAVKQANTNTLKHYSLIDTIQEKLVLETSLAKQIPHRSINLSVIDPRTHTHHITEVRLDEDLKKLKLQASQFGLPFAQAGEELVHFSQKRGVATFQELNQYEIDDKTLLIFNLPENVSQQDIQVKLKQKNCKITFKYCVLGLPAYVRISFQSSEALQRCLQRFNNKKIQFGDRNPVVKSEKDFERLKLANRQLVININPDTKFDKMIVDLSRYGRVMHIDWPLEAYINPTIDEVKQFHKNSRDLIRINTHNADGTIDSQYFPDIKAWKANQDEREVFNIIQKMEDLKQSYENRARFARNIDVYAGRQHQLIIRNRGYCTVTFSTSQESQSYYFSQGGRTQIDLVGRKEEFQYDPTFKKDLLRRIDNEYLIAKKNDFGRKQARIPRKDEEQIIKKSTYQMDQDEINQGRGFQSYYIYEKIMSDRYYKEAMTKNSEYKDFKVLEGYNEFMEWEQHLRIMRRAKNQYKYKTFDEMAEVELYGRVLPKDDKIEKIKFQKVKFGNSEQYNLINKHELLTDPHEIKNRNIFYIRQRERNNRMTDQYLGINHNKNNQSTGSNEESAEHDQSNEPSVQDGENIGKQGFSTTRPAILYRSRTAQEVAQYLRRYNQFIRTNIYQYMGIFQDQLLQETIGSRAEVLNPLSLKFLDGSSYLTESELTDVLQFRRDFKRAQEDYDSYIIGNEYIKSSNININSLTANYQSFEKQALQQLIDVGLVEQTRKVQGSLDQLKKKTNILNTEVAEFGQEYKLETLNDEQYLVKIRKLQHLVPIDRIDHLERVVQEIDNTITPEQAEIFQKNYKHMKQTGNIPSEVRKAFRIEERINVSELMSEMGLVYNISKKDIQMTERMRQYSKQEINQDINNQYNIEKERRHKRKINSEDFSKDPSEIYVKDREGYYKVSRYRQI